MVQNLNFQHNSQYDCKSRNFTVINRRPSRACQFRAFVSCGRFHPVSFHSAICQQFGHAASMKQFGFLFGFLSFPVSTLGVLKWKRAS